MGEIDLPPFRVRVCVYLRHGALRCAPLMHAARAPGACQQEMQVAEIEFRRWPWTLLPTQVPVNEDGSFLAFGQGTSGTVTRAGKD